MTDINPFGSDYAQEVERESFYFDNIRELAESNLADPGDEFELDLQILPVTNYYGMERAIIVRDGVSTLGWLPDETRDYWWPLACALHDAGEQIEVPGRVWTCPDWEGDFYASVRLAMPTMAEAETEIENDFVELTAENRKAWTNFENYIEEYWDERWVKAHGMSDEEVQRRHDETARAVRKIMAEREAAPSTTPEYTSPENPFANERPSQPEPAPAAPKALPPNFGASPVPAQVINRPVMWILWVFLGLLGGHRFYLGNIGMGIIQLFTAGGFGVWWIVDAFIMHKRARAIDSGIEPRIKF